MIEVNAMGEACPIPVVKTLHALQELNGAGTVQTLVDNEIAVQNLTRLAESKGCAIRTEKRGEKEFCVTITTEGAVAESGDEEISCTVPAAQKKTVVVISADHMGEGDDELKNLAALGVEILTCGTCLSHYGLTDRLQVGGVTNMYVITEKQMQADLVLRP